MKIDLLQTILLFLCFCAAGKAMTCSDSTFYIPPRSPVTMLETDFSAGQLAPWDKGSSSAVGIDSQCALPGGQVGPCLLMGAGLEDKENMQYAGQYNLKIDQTEVIPLRLQVTFKEDVDSAFGDHILAYVGVFFVDGGDADWNQGIWRGANEVNSQGQWHTLEAIITPARPVKEVSLFLKTVRSSTDSTASANRRYHKVTLEQVGRRESCNECHPSCQACSGASRADCTACTIGDFVQGQMCPMACLPGEFMDGDAQCVRCPALSTPTATQDGCECAEGFVFDAERVQCVCQPGMMLQDAEAQYLLDESFESGRIGNTETWANSASLASLVTTGCRSGSYCLAIEQPDVSTTNSVYVRQTVRLDQSQGASELTMGGYYKLDAVVQAGSWPIIAYADVFYADETSPSYGAIVITRPPNPTLGEWHYVEGAFTPSHPISHVEFYLYIRHDDAVAVKFDDWHLVRPATCVVDAGCQDGATKDAHNNCVCPYDGFVYSDHRCQCGGTAVETVSTKPHLSEHGGFEQNTWWMAAGAERVSTGCRSGSFCQRATSTGSNVVAVMQVDLDQTQPDTIDVGGYVKLENGGELSDLASMYLGIKFIDDSWSWDVVVFRPSNAAMATWTKFNTVYTPPKAIKSISVNTLLRMPAGVGAGAVLFDDIFVTTVGQCAACHSSCSTCTGTLATQCATCPPGRFLTAGGQCAALCPSGSYGDATTRTCIACDGACPCAPGTFSASGFGPCDSCPAGHATSLYGSTECQPCGSSQITDGVECVSCMGDSTPNDPEYTQCVCPQPDALFTYSPSLEMCACPDGYYNSGAENVYGYDFENPTMNNNMWYKQLSTIDEYGAACHSGTRCARMTKGSAAQHAYITAVFPLHQTTARPITYGAWVYIIDSPDNIYRANAPEEVVGLNVVYTDGSFQVVGSGHHLQMPGGYNPPITNTWVKVEGSFTPSKPIDTLTISVRVGVTITTVKYTMYGDDIFYTEVALEDKCEPCDAGCSTCTGPSTTCQPMGTMSITKEATQMAVMSAVAAPSFQADAGLSSSKVSLQVIAASALVFVGVVMSVMVVVRAMRTPAKSDPAFAPVEAEVGELVVQNRFPNRTAAKKRTTTRDRETNRMNNTL